MYPRFCCKNGAVIGGGGKTVGRSNLGEKIRHVDFGSSIRQPGREIYWAAGVQETSQSWEHKFGSYQHTDCFKTWDWIRFSSEMKAGSVDREQRSKGWVPEHSSVNWPEKKRVTSKEG